MEKRWPNMRFAKASLYPTDKSMIPQFEVSMSLNPDLEVLIKGNEPGAREFIGPTEVLMGEPMTGWVEKQREWVDVDLAQKYGDRQETEKMTVSTEEGPEFASTDDYAAQMGQRRDQID